MVLAAVHSRLEKKVLLFERLPNESSILVQAVRLNITIRRSALGTLQLRAVGGKSGERNAARLTVTTVVTAVSTAVIN